MRTPMLPIGGMLFNKAMKGDGQQVHLSDLGGPKLEQHSFYLSAPESRGRLRFQVMDVLTKMLGLSRF